MAVVLHQGTRFLVAQQNGDVLPGNRESNGFFLHDCRFLSDYQLLLGGQSPILLTTRTDSDSEASYFLASPALEGLPPAALSIVRRQALAEGFEEQITIQNYGDKDATLDLSFQINTDFESIFVVKDRAQTYRHRPQTHPVRRIVGDDSLSLELMLDHPQARRVSRISFNHCPEWKNEEPIFRVRLNRGESYSLHIRVGSPIENQWFSPPSQKMTRKEVDVGTVPTFDDPWFTHIYTKAAEDLASLRIKAGDTLEHSEAVAAGIPWYMALFGRDSLIASYQALETDSSLARGTLRALARLQGRRDDPVSLEGSGKILHEYRKGSFVEGEAAIPKFPYYGSIDATALFLIVLSEYVHHTSDDDLARELWPNVERALAWLDASCGKNGFISYSAPQGAGLINQGWKDSSDSVRFRDGQIAQGPIALVEVQGYTFAAKRKIADIADRLGKSELTEELRLSASELQKKIISSFWLEDRQYFAEALDGMGRKVDALTSNPGHLLWCEALPQDLARKVADQLVSHEGLFSGYGIRTMARTEGGYNPISYHNGSVWPHDNSLIADGLMRYGFFSHASTVIDGLFKALRGFQDGRLPELFAGYREERYGTPIEYPSACRPQAWASGAVLLLTRFAHQLKSVAKENSK